MDKNKLKKIIIIFCVLLLTTLIVLLMLNKKNKTEEGTSITETPNLDGGGEYTEKISFMEYEVIKVCLQQYEDTLNTESSSYYGRDDSNNYVKIVEEKDIKQNIINLFLGSLYLLLFKLLY